MHDKQISLGHDSKIKRLLHFISNLEEKLLSVKSIDDQLHEFISNLSKTHQTILEELTTIKTILNETTIERTEQDEETIPLDETKSEWDDEDDEEEVHIPVSTKEFESKSVTNLNSINDKITRPTDRLSLCSASSYGSSSTSSSTIENRPTSSTSKRSSNLKRSDQTSSLSRLKSPKSVTFSLDQNNKDSIEPTIEKSSTETNEIFDQMITPVIPSSHGAFRPNSDLIPDLFKEHHSEVTTKPNIGYNMGNALTNVRIHEIESNNGDYLRLLNISNSDDYDLGGHFLQQNIACVPVCRFRFPYNTIIRAGQTITVWCGALTAIEPQPPHVFVWKEQRRWETGPECVTILAKPSGQAIAWARSSHRLNNDQSSSDILFVHSKCNIGTLDAASITSNSFKSRSRLSAFNFIGNNKPPFAHSPNSSVHPDHNGTSSIITHDLRSQMHQKGGLSQLLNRPKSSPFASHTGCKQDLISMNYLRKQQIQGHKQSSVKT